MESGNPMLWLAWACFGGFAFWVTWRKLLPAVLQAPPPPALSPSDAVEPVKAPPAWLFCEDGAALDRRVRWFALRPGGVTVVGARPRAATADAVYLYLTADDIREDHLRVVYHADNSRYEAEAVGGSAVQHNNEPLPAGERAELADGDTLDLGRISRFRFTLTGPEDA